VHWNVLVWHLRGCPDSMGLAALAEASSAALRAEPARRVG
jgi:hypothetical protein